MLRDQGYEIRRYKIRVSHRSIDAFVAGVDRSISEYGIPFTPSLSGMAHINAATWVLVAEFARGVVATWAAFGPDLGPCRQPRGFHWLKFACGFDKWGFSTPVHKGFAPAAEVASAIRTHQFANLHKGYFLFVFY